MLCNECRSRKGGAVGGKKRHIDPVAQIDLPDMFQIVPVLAVTAVFILNLHCDNVTAVCNKVRFKNLYKLFKIIFYVTEIDFIIASEFNVFIL